MTNTIRLKITCFLLLFTVLLIKGILDLAWHLATRMKFGTCEQNWDLYGTISGLSPKFGTSFKALFLLFGFFIFRDQIFRNRDQDFFPRPNLFETETETFFLFEKSGWMFGIRQFLQWFHGAVLWMLPLHRHPRGFPHSGHGQERKGRLGRVQAVLDIRAGRTSRQDC